MGKASRGKRERHEQPGQKPPEQQKTWCNHCLDTLHSSGIGPIGEALVEAYAEMRRGEGLDREYSHEETIEWIEGEVGTIISALRSSGDRYVYECALESKADLAGFYSHDPEGYAQHYSTPPAPWTDQEIADYEAMMARQEKKKAS